ncbi:hypothetical protein L2725_20000 [Shewanella corallii]|uniref:Yip1 domain-containing protein n=1 Tax=Shewanella corallii TaxID=560080 RepID=A0ABT0NE08_9GAMM|nr:hypothetical protein [Shewanella corallii]MCL2916027.1 hypothetical protein [Shewanella corallii]
MLSPVASFTYIDKLFNTVQLSGDLKKLVLSGIQHPTLILNSVGEGVYQADNRSSASHVLGVETPGTLTLSNGFTTYRQADNLQFVSLWASLVLGLISLLFLLCRGLYCLLGSRGEHKQLPIVTAFYMFPVLLIPLPFLLTQPFLNIGNINAGSVLLALSCLVALALNVAALWQNRTGNKLDSFAIAGVIQWFLVLAWWGLFPVMLWRI